jgi:bifunctional UDP-N-acetylglucosamine pyrophosphorylase/glucosamine-1-phosphate N-acetyltransferase
LGANVNIGAGAVTCNYDGVRKHATQIDEGAFIGSGSMLVAPLSIGPGAKIGAGSVVTHDVPANALVYGVPARVRGTVRPGQVEVPPEDARTEEQRIAQEQRVVEEGGE